MGESVIDVGGSDARASIDVVEPPIDLISEPPVDAEVVSEPGSPVSDHPSASIAEIVEPSAGAAPPRLRTAADVENDEVSDPGDLAESVIDLTDAGPSTQEIPIVAPEVPVVSDVAPVVSDEVPVVSDVAPVAPEVPGPSTQEIPIVAPEVPVVSDETPSLFDAGDDDSDPFIAQLREAITSDEPLPEGDDAMAAFFDQDDSDSEKGWFGRRH